MSGDVYKDVMGLLQNAQEDGEQPLRAKEEILQELLEKDAKRAAPGEEAAMVEYAMMMRHWEALVQEYERMEAEEQAAAPKDERDGG